MRPPSDPSLADDRTARALVAPPPDHATSRDPSSEVPRADPRADTAVVLVVDDTAANRYTARRWLERAGFRVVEAATGAEALERARAGADLVLLDVVLPDLDGFEVARRLKADSRTAHLPVLHLSAERVGATDRALALEGGADGYLAQPVEPAELVATVRALLRLARSELALRAQNAELAAANRVAEQARAEADRARQAAEAALRAGERLLRLGTALAKVTSVGAAADAALAAGLEVLEASTGGLYLVDATTGAQVLAASRGFPEDVVAGFGVVPADAAVPSAEAVRTGETVILRSPADMAARYPHLAAVWEAMATRALVVVPLAAAGRVTGTLGYAFDRPREFPDEEIAFATAVAQRASQALERARLFDAERDARRAAEQANAVKMQFLATISHELRTPLNAIGGYAQLLELGVRGPVTPTQREDLRRIQQSQAHVVGLLDTVLDYARVDAGQVRYNTVVAPVEECLRVVEALVAPLVRERGVDYACAPSAPGLAVRADQEKLRQILVNLLTNAVKFTPRGGRIGVTCVAASGALGERVVVRVSDTGIGIPAEQLPRIFDPFVQVRAPSASRDGVGLGLAISRDLARGMGGDLTAESVVGVGSTFTLTLPRGRTPDAASSA